MPTRLFDDIERTEPHPILHSEKGYSYLNQSARAPAHLIRQTLEAWFIDYPEEHKDNLKRDFIKKVDGPAFTELLIYTTLRKLDAENIRIHPTVPHAKTRPDFAAVLGRNDSYVEVKNTTECENPRIQKFIDDANGKLRTTGFLLDLLFEGELATPISVKDFKKFFDAQTQAFDRSNPRDANGNLPVWVFTCEAGRIHIEPFLCSDPTKVFDRPIETYSPYDAYTLSHRMTLFNSLNSKARRYGRLDKPFLIATNFANGFLEPTDVAQALFGDESSLHRHDGKGFESHRRRNTLWSRKHNTRVSGVLIMDKADPWLFWERTPELWINPWAAKPLDKTFFEGRITIREADRASDQLVPREEANFAALLGLDRQHWTSVFNQRPQQALA